MIVQKIFFTFTFAKAIQIQFINQIGFYKYQINLKMELSETIKETKIIGQKDFRIELFPKVFVPALNENSPICLQQLFMKNSQSIISDLNKHGAILFRDFDIKSPNQCVSLLKQLGFQNADSSEHFKKLDMIIGTKNIKDLNTKPLFMFQCENNSEIGHANFHNQFCQINPCSKFVSLYCFSPALKEGNILLLNWFEVYNFTKLKHPEFLQKLAEKGITQIVTLPETQNLQQNGGNGWRKSFNVSNKREAEEAFIQKNYQFQWLNNEKNQCILKRRKVFNSDLKGQISSNLNQIFSLYKDCLYRKRNLQQLITFGNGQKIPINIVQEIYKHSQNAISEIQCKKGDFLILDYENVKYIHSPMVGPQQLRKIYVSFMKRQSILKKAQIIQTLNNGYQLPFLGFGTWKIPKSQCEQVVYQAIKSGYRLLDCAAVYGNQVQVGKGIRKAISQKIVKREELFITSKLWNTNHSPEHVRPACQRTLKDLKLQYLDLYLIHFPISLKYVPPQKQYPAEWIYDTSLSKPIMIESHVPVLETWKAMQDLTSAKHVRNIGVSNFTVSLLRQLVYGCQIKPSVLQIQMHPQLNQQKIIRFARQHGVQVTSYSSFGASSYVQLGMAKQSDPIYKNQVIKQLAKKYNRSAHQIVLRWVIQKGIAIIPKSVNPQRMKQNFKITQFALTQQDMQTISNFNKNKRYNDPVDFCENFLGAFYPLYE